MVVSRNLTIDACGVSPPNAWGAKQPVQLLLPEVRDRGFILKPWYALRVAGDIPVQQSERSNEVRLMHQPAPALAEHKQRMITRAVVCPTVLHQNPPNPVRLAGRPMLNQPKVAERSRSPTEPLRRDLIDGVDRKSTRLNSSHLGISYAV